MGGNLSHPTVDLANKVVVITGGNAGIGYETTKAIALMGAHAIIACRSEDRAQTAIEQMKQEVSSVQPDKTINVEFMKLDLSSFKSTKDFTVAFKEKNIPLHILINNAGQMGMPLSQTEDGNENHLQINHLSHFLLTLELLPIILDTAAQTGDGRIVILSSDAHKSGVFDPANLNGERQYGRLDFYSNSKLFNVMHGFALQRRLKDVGVTVSSLHPGFIHTEIVNKGVADSGGVTAFWKVTKFVSKPLARSIQQGAVTTINCAVNPELNKQQHFYYSDCKVTRPKPVSEDAEVQEQLWEVSVEKVKNWLSPEILERYGSRMDVGQRVEGQSPVTPPTKADEKTQGSDESGAGVQKTEQSDQSADDGEKQTTQSGTEVTSEPPVVEGDGEDKPAEEPVSPTVDDTKQSQEDEDTPKKEEEVKDEQTKEEVKDEQTKED